MVVLEPKPRMLKGCPVGWSWPVGTVNVQTPGILLTIWSTPVSGIAWICWRDRTVVLTSSFSISEPRAALTVTGGRTTGGCGLGGAAGCGLDGSVWACADAGTTANPAKAAKVA